MRIRTFGTLILATAFVIAPGALLAQSWKGWRGSGGWGPGSPYQRMYDPQTVQTINGTVASVDKAMPLRGMSAGIHLMVKIDGKEALIASEVKKGDETLVLRDSAGIPAWAGWRR